jgi:auxin influx carrier (AUX1 LAX family)
VFIVNWVVVVVTLVAGLGAGGFASVTNLVKAVNTFGFFAKCYQC